jgi:hypothetical protein
MRDPIVIMSECRARVVRRIDVDTLDLPAEILFECFEGQEVIAEDQSVVKNVIIASSRGGVVGPCAIFN